MDLVFRQGKARSYSDQSAIAARIDHKADGSAQDT